MIHTCEGCGLVHDAPATAAAPSAEVEIARIQADRDVAVAKLGARQDHDWNETREVIAEIEAGAQVESAGAVAEIMTAEAEIATAAPEPDPDPGPVVINAPVADADGGDATEELPPAEGSPAPEPARKSRGLGMW